MNKKIRFAGVLLSAMLLISSLGCLVQDTAQTEPAEPTSDASPASSGSVASLPSYDRDAVAVTLGDVEITAGEIEDGYSSYLQLLSYYGMAAPTDDATINEYVQMIVEDLLSAKLPLWKAREQGIELSTEELAAVDVSAHNQADAEYNDLVLSYAAYYTDAGEVENITDLTEQQLADTLVYLNADIKDFYEDDDADIDFYVSDAYDNYYQNALVEAYSAKLKEISDASVVLDQDALEEWYESALADQKELFENDATLYRTHREDYASGLETVPPLYIPQNLAVVQVITLTPEGQVPSEITENLSKMTTLEAEYGNIVLSGGDESRLNEIKEEYAALQESNQKMKDEYFGKEYAHIQEMKERLDAGEDYSSVASENASFLQEQILCYVLDYAYPTVVTDAVAKLNDGDTSGILFDGSSYYLVHLVGKLTPGSTDREPIEDALRNAASTEQRDAAWEEQLSAWEEEALAAAVYHPDAYAYVGH